jgi:hypothetical protein
MATERDYASAEQRLYAGWLDLGARIGFVVLVASFVVYVTGLVPPGVAHAELPRYWSLPVTEYLAATGAPSGWGWIARLGESDLLNFVGVAILGMVTILCYARVLAAFVRSRERALAAICIAEIVVLVVAASGILGAGH